MTIIHLAESLGLGGMERVIALLVQVQQPKGRALCLASEGAVAQSMRRENLPVDILDPNFGGGWLALPFLTARLKRLRPFLLHTHGAARAVGRLAGRLAGASKVVHHLHGTEVYGWRQRRFERAYPADLYVACCRAVSEDFQGQVGPMPMEVVYNPVDIARFRFDPQLRAQARRELGIADGQFLVLTVGRFAPDKGQRFLVQAAPSLLSRWPHAVIAFLGDGASRPEAERQAAALGGAVRFLGNRDPLAYLNACDVYVQPSIGREAMPMAVLEAMACARPVVASRLQGLPEAVGDAGALVPPGDAPALAEAIGSLLESAERLRSLGAAARKRAEEQFSISLMSKRLEELYQRR